MSRILYWNINNFSEPKIWNTGGPIQTFQANDQRFHIVNEVMAAPNAGGVPDVIIVAEVHSRVREVRIEGTALQEAMGAGLGVLRLLATIRAHPSFGPQWCMVPPLYLGEGGQSECVAVYYDSNNLQFTGPNIFCELFPLAAVNVGWSQPVTQFTYNHRLNYSLTWQGAQPVAAGRTHNFPINGGTPIPEIQMAGEWQYYTTPPARPIPSPTPPAHAANRLFFPNLGCRGPFWTRFLDANGRTLNLFTIHTSPNSAAAAILQMGQIAQMTAPLAAGEVRVVLGDFNVDTFDPFAFATYGWLDAVAGGGLYTMALDPRDPATALVDPARKPYCMTHMMGPGEARPFNNTGVPTDPQHNVYPRYGYMGSTWPFINDSGALDNFFTAYGGGAAPGPAANITVVNSVVGTPYNAIAPPPGGGVTAELTGGLAYPSTLFTPIPQAAAPGGVNPPVDNINFPAWLNFSRIYRTSDHLPLMIDV